MLGVLCVGVLTGCGGGSMKTGTVPERLLGMEWEESADVSLDEFQTMLEDESILYTSVDQGDGYIQTTTTEKFLGYDCIFSFGDLLFYDFHHGNLEDIGLSLIYPNKLCYYIAFKDEDNFKDGRKKIDNYMTKNLAKGQEVLNARSSDGDPYYSYIFEITDRHIDKFNTTGSGGTDSDYSIYKFVNVYYVHVDEYSPILDQFFPDKSYTNNVCTIYAFYAKMSDEDYRRCMAFRYNYDSDAKKDIDVEAYIKENKMDELLTNSFVSDDLIRLYFMREHNYDILMDKEITDQEERDIWYISNYGWDNRRNQVLDLSGYEDSLRFYCILNYNYDISTGRYFQSDLDREALLANEFNYNEETGDYFEDSLSCSLYFANKFNYNLKESKYFEDDLDCDLFFCDNFNYNRYENDCFTSAVESALLFEEKYNYNRISDSYFKDDFDKAIYFAYPSYNYNLDTGTHFSDEMEMDMYFLEKYSYILKSKEQLEKPVADALVAYLRYLSQGYQGYELAMIYLDNDDIPDVLASKDHLHESVMLLTYHNGEVCKVDLPDDAHHIRYLEKGGQLYSYNIAPDGLCRYFYAWSLSDGVLECDVSSHIEFLLDEPYYRYTWNDKIISLEEFMELFGRDYDSQSMVSSQYYYQSWYDAFSNVGENHD